jgi:hypothetical protein
VPTPTPLPPLDVPTIACAPPNGTEVPYTLSCYVTNPPGTFLPSDTFVWYFTGSASIIYQGPLSSCPITDPDTYHVQLFVTRGSATEHSLAWGD